MNTETFLAFLDSSREFIPFVAIVMPFVFVLCMLGLKFHNERSARELQHQTYRIALEKGATIPPELLQVPLAEHENKAPVDDRKAGLILLAVGISIFLTLNGMGGLIGDNLSRSLRWAALIPGLIGVALLMNWELSQSASKKAATPPETSTEKKS